MRVRRLALAVASAVLFLVLTVSASTPRFWQVSTQADFLSGEVENLSIDGDGRLVLGPAAETVYESSAPFLWALASAPDGGLWAGSGNEGKVFRIDKSGKASTFFDSAELEAHAVVAAPDGSLLVGTSPDGKVYRVKPNGDATPLFDPEDRYIWALALDRSGNLFAATGDKGTIYRITPDGKATTFYRTKATHVTALAFDAAGNLLAGTESPGKIFRITAEGKGFVLLDSPFREIHALRVDPKGAIYAAAVSARSGPEEREPERPEQDTSRGAPVPSVSTEITAIAIGDVQVGAAPITSAPSRRDDREPRGAVYRISQDGVWDTVWESAADAPYDLTFDTAGGLIIGTGGTGKIFRVSGDPMNVTLLTRAAAQQVTMFLRDGSGALYYATANPGKIFRISAARAERGSYVSAVRDARTVATWGSIRWRSNVTDGAAVQLFTRSGNTAIPDDTWSDWSAAYRDPNGQQISSPKARYLQWRAVLTGGATPPILTSVTAAYLERNLRPEVGSITVHPPGVVFQKPFSTGELEIAGYDESLPDGRTLSSPASASSGAQPTPQLGRRVYQKGLQTFVWRADDENDDRLQYDVLYRVEGETGWKTLKRGLDDPILAWDTSAVPDGTYVVKVAASDAPSNSPGTALVGELESSAFEIDNTPPTITVESFTRDGGRAILTFRVRDAHSPVQRVEYSLDANRWRVVYPKDGISDSREESFEVTIEGQPPARNVIVRATDAMSNAATATAQPAGQM